MQGGQIHGDFDYPDIEWQYFLLAERFGWTPTQVDEQPAVLVDWLIAIGNTVDEVKNQKSQ
jgi:hypothetical protein